MGNSLWKGTPNWKSKGPLLPSQKSSADSTSIDEKWKGSLPGNSWYRCWVIGCVSRCSHMGWVTSHGLWESAPDYRKKGRDAANKGGQHACPVPVLVRSRSLLLVRQQGKLWSMGIISGGKVWFLVDQQRLRVFLERKLKAEGPANLKSSPFDRVGSMHAQPVMPAHAVALCAIYVRVGGESMPHPPSMLHSQWWSYGGDIANQNSPWHSQSWSSQCKFSQWHCNPTRRYAGVNQSTMRTQGSARWPLSQKCPSRIKGGVSLSWGILSLE